MGKLWKLAFFAIILVILSTVIVGAQSPDCDKVVSDQAGLFDGNSVEIEAQKLIALGVEVRVRTIDSYGNLGSLERYVDSIQESCLSWKAADNGFRNNLVVLAISVDDRQTGIYFGEEWRPVLANQWEKIVDERMNPRFRDGDFTGGFVNGLKEVTRLVNVYVNPPAAAAPAQPVVVVEQRPASPPPDLSGLWKVLYWMIAFAALAGLAVGAATFIGRAQRESGKRREAQQKARLGKKACADRITSWSERENILSALIESVSVPNIGQKLKQAQDLFGQASVDYADLQNSAGDPDRPGLSVGEYANIEKAYQSVLANLQRAAKLADEIESNVQKMKDLERTTPGILAQAAGKVDSCQKEVRQVANKGFRTGIKGSVGQDSLDQAWKALEEKHYQEAIDLAKAAIEKAKQAAEKANALPRLKQEIDQEIGGLTAQIQEAKSLVNLGREAFDRIDDVYSESCWASVSGNGTEAENRINWAEGAKKAAITHASMESQEWAKAQEALKDGQGWLLEAASLMESIHTLEKNLQAAKRDAQGEIEAAQKDIDTARAYILQHDEDVREELEGHLERAQETLAKAKTEAASAKPDYLIIVKLAQRANSEADEILSLARSEHEQAERLRQRAHQSRRDAQAGISKASKYIASHERDVRSAARGSLTEAETLFTDIASASNLEKQISLAEKAEELAEEAYRQAVKDVEDAEEARRPQYHSGYSGWGSYSPTPTHRPSSSSSRPNHDDDSGGSSVWGSNSSSGGGGSIGWGSSRRSGGSGSSSSSTRSSIGGGSRSSSSSTRSSRGGGSKGW